MLCCCVVTPGASRSPGTVDPQIPSGDFLLEISRGFSSDEIPPRPFRYVNETSCLWSKDLIYSKSASELEDSPALSKLTNICREIENETVIWAMAVICNLRLFQCVHLFVRFTVLQFTFKKQVDFDWQHVWFCMSTLWHVPSNVWFCMSTLWHTPSDMCGFACSHFGMHLVTCSFAYPHLGMHLAACVVLHVHTLARTSF